MERLNRDVYVAIALLLFCGVMFWASFDIREPDYGVLPPSAWPRVIIGAMTLLTLVYLAQSLKAGAGGVAKRPENEPTTLMGWIKFWRNPITCFITFGVYLALMPLLGMLLDSMLFVFTLMCLLGGIDGRKLVTHAVVAAITVGGMWSLFTFGLNVLLPTGALFE